MTEIGITSLGTAWLDRVGERLRQTGIAALAVVGWGVVAAVTTHYPDLGDWGRSGEFALIATAIAAALAVASLVGLRLRALAARVRHVAPWALALAVVFALWEWLTAKAGLLPQPFFPPPQAILEVYTDDVPKLAESTLHSLRLHLVGYGIGASAGFLIGVSIGWSKAIGYWVHPLLRFLGPLPATAWLPIAFFAFPSSWSASVFLIALATGFPVAVLTWSGVASVPTAYYDIARTLGAGGRFLIFRVAIPSALPYTFVGLFMGLGSSFAVLVVAELLGVKAGLGWYLQWAQGWASYANMYAALIVMAVLCSSLMALLFRIRDHFLAWQKGLLQW